MLPEIWGRINHPQHLDHLLDLVEIPDLGFQGREQVQSGETCGLVSLFRRNLIRHFSAEVGPVGLHWTMAREVDQLSVADGTDIISPWRRGLGEFNTQSFETFFDG